MKPRPPLEHLFKSTLPYFRLPFAIDVFAFLVAMESISVWTTDALKQQHFVELLVAGIATSTSGLEAQEGLRKFFTVLRLETGIETKEQVQTVYRLCTDFLRAGAPVLVKTTLVNLALIFM